MNDPNPSSAVVEDPLRDPRVVFDVRPIPGRVKHAQIFQRWLDLPVNEFFILLNDHDPVPLRYQFEREFSGAFTWEYVERGPEEFRVKITKLQPVIAPLTLPRGCGSGGHTADPHRDPQVVFDVRPIPGRVKHAQIFQRWLDLPVGKFFVLLNDHDPVPLRYQFEHEFNGAFAWEYLEQGPEEYRVKITKLKAVHAPGELPGGCGCDSPTETVAADVREIDVRGLEPPEPLVRVLDALESLPAGVKLQARTDREPCHLFGEAKERGFSSDCTQQPDGSWLTVLARV